MGLEANLVYLEAELRSLQERIAAIRDFLLANPSSSIYRRKIKGRVYYYKKFRKGGKSVSKFLGGSGFDHKAAAWEFKRENEKSEKAKLQLAKLKREKLALEKQARIARKAYDHAGT
ncbi:MAG: hypothetical protein KJ808_05880 [Acidobacteria bacterium]|nr:hypothetical protein [Acidobacteriota bacterium]MBU4307042.1 hypothetical protein [Acidobacteriota bacterium]MBU4405782.1 hypothetical protein [Acidobacteriota bacterium]MCG2810247.1 hypothetical protein [Candidatus Aminicenantes bacterium]